jgi:DNA repair exonuclease SbcCD nuclease subunit
MPARVDQVQKHTERDEMKLAITADLHFGVPGRLQDTHWACRVIREYCRLANIDVVLVLGDMFHDRRTLDIEVLWTSAKFFEETAEKFDQKWIVFPGNHDMFLRHSWQVNSLLPLRKHLTVIETVKLLKLDDHRFWVLPFIQYERPYMRVLNRIEDRSEEGDVLLTHVGVRGATLNTCFLLKDWSIVSFDYSKFKRIYTGHFHSKQALDDKVYYPGSPIPFKFDEGDIAHGFYVYDTDDSSHKFVNIWKAGEKFFPEEKAPPQFSTLLDELLGEKKPEDVRNHLIRVALQREYTQEEKRTIKDRLTAMGAVSVRWWQMNQKLDKKPQEALQVAAPHRQFFRAWIEADQKNVQDLDLAILNRTHDDVVQEGDELYSVEEADTQ